MRSCEGANRQLFGSFSAGDLSVLPRMAPKPVISKEPRGQQALIHLKLCTSCECCCEGFALSSAGFALLKNAPGGGPDPPVSMLKRLFLVLLSFGRLLSGQCRATPSSTADDADDPGAHGSLSYQQQSIESDR